VAVSFIRKPDRLRERPWILGVDLQLQNKQGRQPRQPRFDNLVRQFHRPSGVSWVGLPQEQVPVSAYSAIGSPPGAVRGYATGPRFLGAFPHMRIPIDDLQVRHAPKAEQ
jgi:hypothetical protein